MIGKELRMMTSRQIAVLVLSNVNCHNTLSKDVIDIAIRSIIAWDATVRLFLENNNELDFSALMDDLMNEVSHMESEEMIQGFLEGKFNENND